MEVSVEQPWGPEFTSKKSTTENICENLLQVCTASTFDHELKIWISPKYHKIAN